MIVRIYFLGESIEPDAVVQGRKIISEVHGAMPDLKMENSRNRIFVLRL